MADIAEAAYQHALEEKAGELFEPTALYDVIDQQTGEKVVSISRGAYLLSDPNASRAFSPVDGLVRYNDQGQLSMVMMNWQSLGLICGLNWVDGQGRAFTLEQVGFLQSGRMMPLLRDIESYRLTLDRLELARDAGDAEAAQWLQQVLAGAPFGVCPICRGHFALAEDCVACQGRGIVWSDISRWSPAQ